MKVAKVEISVDSESKAVSISVDGKKVSNVHYVSVYTEESGYFGLSITSMLDESKDGGLKKMIHLMASDNEDFKNKYGKGKILPSGLIEVDDNTALQTELQKLLSRK